MAGRKAYRQESNREPLQSGPSPGAQVWHLAGSMETTSTDHASGVAVAAHQG
ncbi:MAG TPA: hypothetical protein VK513_14855 [Terriglobales bacterium]|nr:hypothetical protein [Terriglobales bacterium]